MNQNIWGPHFWITLHTLTFNYPLNPSHSDKHNYHTFFTILKDILPCSVCRRHFNRKLKEDPLKHHLNSRREIVEWMIDCHNKVNAETGKRYYSIDEVLKIYSQKYSMKIDLNALVIKKTDYKIYTNILLSVLVILLIVIILYKMRHRIK
jgi:hypothetical protein